MKCLKPKKNYLEMDLRKKNSGKYHFKKKANKLKN